MSDPKELRYARNRYNSAVSEAAGFVSGRRVETVKLHERELRDMLWANRDALIDAYLASAAPKAAPKPPGPVTKAEFLRAVAKLYEVGNRSDSDSPLREDWTHPDMAGPACCALLDKMLTRMIELGVITRDEHQQFIDDLI